MAIREIMALSLFVSTVGAVVLSAWMSSCSPIELLPAGSHIWPIVWFDPDVDTGVWSNSINPWLDENGIDSISIGYIRNGEPKCLIHVQYFYGRELCWDGQQGSFVESFR